MRAHNAHARADIDILYSHARTRGRTQNARAQKKMLFGVSPVSPSPPNALGWGDGSPDLCPPQFIKTELAGRLLAKCE